MTGGVDDEQTGNIEVEVALVEGEGALLDGRLRNIRRADLLSDATRLAVLNVRATDVVENLRLAGVDVTEDADDRAAQLVLGPYQLLLPRAARRSSFATRMRSSRCAQCSSSLSYSELLYSELL